MYLMDDDQLIVDADKFRAVLKRIGSTSTPPHGYNVGPEKYMLGLWYRQSGRKGIELTWTGVDLPI